MNTVWVLEGCDHDKLDECSDDCTDRHALGVYSSLAELRKHAPCGKWMVNDNGTVLRIQVTAPHGSRKVMLTSFYGVREVELNKAPNL